MGSNVVMHILNNMRREVLGIVGYMQEVGGKVVKKVGSGVAETEADSRELRSEHLSPMNMITAIFSPSSLHIFTRTRRQARRDHALHVQNTA